MSHRPVNRYNSPAFSYKPQLRVSKISSLVAFFAIIIILALMTLSLFNSPASSADGGSVAVSLTTPDQRSLLAPQAAIAFSSDTSGSPLTIRVDESQSFQAIDGAGAALTDSSAWLIYNKLSPTERDALMTKLFDPTNGIGLGMVRLPMGASDFSASGNYTYNDIPDGQVDPTLANFSIKHDLAYIVPLLKQALQLNPKLKIIASPWSPPAWMKTNNSLIGGSLNPAYYQAYANYFVKFLLAYAAQGVPVFALTIQNEPQFSPPGYPGMLMDSSEQANFIKNYLGPALASNRLSTKILVWDHNWDRPDYPLSLLNDATVRSYVAGTAFHCYAGDVTNAQNQVHNAYPDKDIYQTECSGGEWLADFGAELKGTTLNSIIYGMRSWSKSVFRWNVALDQNHGPLNGGCTDCRGLVTINQTTGQVSYNVDYYELGQLSKFVKPGAVRIASNTISGSIENVAFKNPDGSKVLLALNVSSSPNSFKVVWGNQAFNYTLAGGAVATFSWSGTLNPAPVISALNQLKATNANSMVGLQLESCQDNGGGQDVGWADNNDYLVFNNLDFGTGANQIEARVATASSGGLLEIRLDSLTGTLVGSLNITNTGGWQNWRTFSTAIANVTGVHNLYLIYRGGNAIGNLNWFKFSNTSSTSTATATAQPTNTATPRPTNTATAQPTNTATAQPTNTATAQPTNTATAGNAATAAPANTATTAPTAQPNSTATTATASGTVLLDRNGWQASASSSPTNPCCTVDVPSHAIDGDSSTRWSSGLAQANGQWFKLDLAATRTFSKLVLDAGNNYSGDYLRGYQVYVSNDGTNWGNPVASGNGSGQVTTITFPVQSARYIKVIQTGNTGNWWSIVELNLYR